MTRVSIITINLNNIQGLEETMESVFAQTFEDFEYIIVDGESSDGSKEYIEKQSKKLAFWISEKDTGIYNAMNKGIRRAKGEYCLFLNSGDRFYSPESLDLLSANNKGEDIIYGNIMVHESDGKEWFYQFPYELSFGFFYHTNLPHQATLIKRILFNKIGLYNECYKVISDWEFCMNAICKYNCSYIHVNEIVSVFNHGGISTSMETRDLVEKERTGVFENDFPLFMKEYQEYFLLKSEINNYRNSRVHQMVEKIITSNLYKRMKKHLPGT